MSPLLWLAQPLSTPSPESHGAATEHCGCRPLSGRLARWSIAEAPPGRPGRHQQSSHNWRNAKARSSPATATSLTSIRNPKNTFLLSLCAGKKTFNKPNNPHEATLVASEEPGAHKEPIHSPIRTFEPQSAVDTRRSRKLEINFPAAERGQGGTEAPFPPGNGCGRQLPWGNTQPPRSGGGENRLQSPGVRARRHVS